MIQYGTANCHCQLSTINGQRSTVNGQPSTVNGHHFRNPQTNQRASIRNARSESLFTAASTSLPPPCTCSSDKSLTSPLSIKPLSLGRTGVNVLFLLPLRKQPYDASSRPVITSVP